MCIAQPAIQSSVNKKEILIGEQFTLTIKVDFPKNIYNFRWPILSDSMAHFEVTNSRIDSLYTEQNLSSIVQTITFTSFDSGKWVLPSFLVKVDPIQHDTAFNFYTDSVSIIVSFSLLSFFVNMFFFSLSFALFLYLSFSTLIFC